jgi:hypothetical protein
VGTLVYLANLAGAADVNSFHFAPGSLWCEPCSPCMGCSTNCMDPLSPAEPRLVVVCQLFYPELVRTVQTLTELVEELSARGLEITVIVAQPTMVPGSKPVAPLLHRGTGEGSPCA